MLLSGREAPLLHYVISEWFFSCIDVQETFSAALMVNLLCIIKPPTNTNEEAHETLSRDKPELARRPGHEDAACGSSL